MSMVAHKSDSDRLVEHHFFEPLGIKYKGPIHGACCIQKMLRKKALGYMILESSLAIPAICIYVPLSMPVHSCI